MSFSKKKINSSVYLAGKSTTAGRGGGARGCISRLSDALIPGLGEAGQVLKPNTPDVAVVLREAGPESVPFPDNS